MRRMEKTRGIILTEESFQFLSRYLAAFIDQHKNLKADNDKALGTALIYEKFRTSLEYQEDHLVFKNAIARIVRRKYTLLPTINTDQLSSDLINELSWANYLNPEHLRGDQLAAFKALINRYLTLLKYARSGRHNKHELNKIIIDWMACEIDELMNPETASTLLVNYTFEVLNQNLRTDRTRTQAFDNEIQLKIAIFLLLLKPDFPLIEYWLVKNLYPDWKDYTTEEVKKFGRSFDPYFNKIDRALNNPYRARYLQFVKRNIAPFILIKNIPLLKGIDPVKFKENPILLKNYLLDHYDSMVKEARRKVWRGTYRALIFILLTKLSLAFLLEVPFDRYSTGSVEYLSLLINILLPPFLMLVSGTCVKSPPSKNRETVAQAIQNIITQNKVDDKFFALTAPKPSLADRIFNLFYSGFSMAILILVAWLLFRLGFNYLSLFLFFFFVSVVSFFSFRIRSIALELAMKRSRDDALTSAVEFIFLPFIRIGKGISERFARFNPFILALDFLIEAPLKSVIKIINMWVKFISAKKEELEY